MNTGRLLFILVCAVPAARGQFVPKTPPAQPVPFSHRQHSATGIKCVDCHSIRSPGDAAGFPNEARCMGCHATIKTDSPAIQKVAEAARLRRPLSWVRVYRLPKTVYFSHEVHYRKAGADCAICHGPVSQRDAIGLEKSIAMPDCMSCHDRYKASNDCNLCHDSH